MHGKALNKEGDAIVIEFNLRIVASATWEWVEDERPTGWNHSRDEPTYTSTTYASVDVPEIKSISFNPEQDINIDNEPYSIRDAQQQIDPTVLRQLLNPVIYTKLMAPAFDQQGQRIEEPEPEYNEPERERNH